MKHTTFLTVILSLLLIVPVARAQSLDTPYFEISDSIVVSDESFQTVHFAEADSIAYWPVTDKAQIEATCSHMHPVYFKLFSPGTLYGDAVRQEVFCETSDDNDNVLVTNSFINAAIVRSFVNSPWLFTTTQTAISNQTTAVTIAADEPIKPSEPLLVVEEPAPAIMDDGVELDVVAEKPNFWSFDGNGSVHFTQNHISDNWYKGGSNNYTMLSQLKLHAKYDNKQKLQWETTLDCKLGFQTVEDGPNKFRVNNDQLRLSTKLGYKASKYWFYTVQGEATTQFTKTYDGNHKVIGDFISPLRTVLSVGMDYKFSKKKLTGSLLVSPVSMTWTYVDRIDLAKRYGNEPDHHSRVTWGPNVKLDYTWKLLDNVSWNSRMYYFTNFEYVNWEWENTFTFTLNRYISTKFFVYPRFDDSSISYRSKHGSYFMFKEWLSLGLEYSF